MEENKLNETAENLSEIEIAELANKEIRARDEEIRQLKKQLAKEKLLSQSEEEETLRLSREECVKRLSDSNCSNYDYVEAVCGLVEDELDKGKPNPLGTGGDNVYKFFKDCLDACDGDKSKFTSIYQASLGPDDPKGSVKRGR